jgi:glycosyltransferase involved in cell wall biosynthesis/GT2 family glycosyltransferase
VLESFERQTCQDFTVLVMDDGSTLPEAKQQFAAMSEKYAARGWRFAAQANAGPSAARNHAARLAQTEFLLFFDSDDFAAPTLVERMLDGILLTGVDLVVADAWVFEGQNPPVDAAGKPTARPAKRFAWLGQSQLASVMDDQHGGPVIIVRRERFLELGGYREHAVKAAEDYEFNVRATLRGATLDVIPEPLQWYRDSPGSVSKVTPLFHNHESVLRNFRAIFAPHGLHGLEGLLRGLFLEERAARRAVADAPSFPTILKRSRRLRILITAPYPLHPELGGGSLRSCNLARYLAARHQVTVACFGWATPIKIQKQFERFYSIAEGDPREFSWRLPRRTASLHTRAMGTALRILGAQRWDVCLVDQIHMAIYREALEGFRVLSEHNVESSLLARIAALSPEDGQAHHDARLMRELEDHLWPEFPLRCGVSQSDCDEMDRRARRGRSILAPNGCDPDSAIRGLKPDTRTLCFPGSLDYAPNIDAAHYLVEQIWPLVRSRLPQARLLIAGARPVPSIARLQGPDIEVIANPPRMEPVAARTSVLVAPLRAGGGTRIKILNAFAWGLPVVSTALGAEGLEVKDGEHLLLRDDPEEFAKAAVDLLTNESLWRRLQANGRNLARARYSWDQAFTALETEIRRECGLP